MQIKRAIFAVIVIIIVLAFSISIFGSGIVTSCAPASDEAQDTDSAVTAEAEAPDASVSDNETESESVFMQTLKASMIVSENDRDNANNIAKVINVYNALNKENKITDIDGTVSADAVAKLSGAGIYFTDIDAEVEAAAWALITVDANGVAVVN